MSWVDLVIVAIVALSALRGWLQGAIRLVASLAGWIGGFIVGTLIAPSLSSLITHARWRPALALVIVVVAAFVGSQLGHVLGSLVRRTFQAVKLGIVDSAAGVAVGVVGALFACWLIAGVLGSVTWGSVATSIQGSRILTELNAVMPPVPSIEAKVQALFRGEDFPSVFAGIVAPVAPEKPLPASSLGPMVTSLASPSDIVKVLSTGCSLDHEGTAFLVGAHYAVTNAHVVAGAKRVTIDGASVEVALYDPVHDIAVLRLGSAPPGVSTEGMRFEHGVTRAGTTAQVIGFPLNGSRTRAPAIVDGEITGSGRDIYNEGLATRTMIVVNAQVEPGNSGSPVLVHGLVAGVIESESLSQPATAYAIPDAVVQRDLAKTPATGAASTEACLG